MNFRETLKHQKILVLGLGSQGGGVGDALWLYHQGAEVKITDLKTSVQLSDSLKQLPSDITHTLGRHLDSDIEWADMIIKNPAIPDNLSQLILAKQLHKPIYTSIALVVKEARQKTIGITGTRGKSTTTELIYTLLNHFYPQQVVKGGNIAGTSGLQLLDKINNTKYLVLELSSFQLAGFHDLQTSPHYSLLTNIYPDHLNRYPDMQAYQSDKSAIFRYQNSDDYLLVNQDNQLALNLAKNSLSRVIYFHAQDVATWQLNLRGQHNLENVSAVYQLAKLLQLDLQATQTIIESFKPVPFRLELVGEFNGIQFYNDTTSTTPTATIKSLQSFSQPITLILGGDQKNLPFQALLKTIKLTPNLQSIILLGSKNIPEFVTQLKKTSPQLIKAQVDSMSEAVKQAVLHTQVNGVILLSPGFASFDLFKNEFDRGRQFNACVAKLISSETKA